MIAVNSTEGVKHEQSHLNYRRLQRYRRRYRQRARQGWRKSVPGARRLDRIHALADEIRSAGGEAEAQVLDVTSRQSMAAFVQAAREKWGRIDVLINNAGIMPLSPFGWQAG